MAKVAVLCWEESRPWVSTLRQNGYSVPWVEEPKGDVHKQIPAVGADAIVIDFTRRPEQAREMLLDLARREELRGVPLIVVSKGQTAARGLKTKVPSLVVTSPDGLVAALRGALGSG